MHGEAYFSRLDVRHKGMISKAGVDELMKIPYHEANLSLIGQDNQDDFEYLLKSEPKFWKSMMDIKLKHRLLIDWENQKLNEKYMRMYPPPPKFEEQDDPKDPLFYYIPNS